jgi:hypothetical protein
MKSIALALIGMAVTLTAGCSSNKFTNPQNQPPIITALSVTPEQANLGDLITVNSSAYDPEGGQLVYQWETTSGYIIGSGPTVVFNTSYCCVVGLNEILLTVVDQQENAAERKIWVNIEK